MSKTMMIDPETAHRITRLLMAIGFVSAMLALAHKRRLGFAIFYLLAAIETYTKFRYPFQDWFKNFLLSGPLSGTSKQVVQIWMLAGLMIASIIVCGILFKVFFRSSLANNLVLLGTFGVIFVLAMELISHHDVDRFIYAQDGPLVRSGSMYILATLVTVVGAVLCARTSTRYSATDVQREPQSG
jgi:hypothetical protein